MTLREFSGNARQTTLIGDITSASTSFNVASGTGYPTGSTAPFVVVIDRGLASEEKILVATRSANTFTVAQRGFDGTSAGTHLSGVQVEHVLDATTIREANAHVDETGLAHGVDFSLLGTKAELAAHQADTTSVHGIIDTARLALVDGSGKFVAPVAKETVAPAATDPATTQTLVNSLRTALINLGLVQ